MNYMTIEIIKLFEFLFPGFVMSVLFYSLTSFPRKSEFEMVIMALVYTVIINTVVNIVEFIFILVGKSWSIIGEWSSTVNVLWSVFFAIVFGLLLTYLYNNDILHKFLRKLKITKKTSYPTGWYGTFSTTQSYVILHFNDGSRLMGWPLEWPPSSKDEHIVMQKAVWLANNENEQDIELLNIDKILIETNNIYMIEFLKQEEQE